MNDKPNTPPGWNLLGPGNNGTPTDKAAEQPAPMSAEERRAKELWLALDDAEATDATAVANISNVLHFHAAEAVAAYKESLSSQDAEECALCKQYAEENTEQAAEIAVLRNDLADERRRWPECDKHRTGEPDARRGHCAQCGVEREKSKDAEIARLKEELRLSEASAYAWEACVRADNDPENKSPCGHHMIHAYSPDGVGKVIRCHLCEKESALKDLADAKATIAELDAELKWVSLALAGYAVEWDDLKLARKRVHQAYDTIERQAARIAALEAEKAALVKERDSLRDELEEAKADRDSLFITIFFGGESQDGEKKYIRDAEEYLAKQRVEQNSLRTTNYTLRERVRVLEDIVRSGRNLAENAIATGNPELFLPEFITKATLALATDLSTSEEGKAEAVASGHNPDGLSNAQVGVADGWRLLEEDEKGGSLCNLGMQWWNRGLTGWERGMGWVNNPMAMGVRTRLSRAELAQALNLTQEEGA